MYPLLFQLGPLTISSLWAFITLAFLVSLLIVYKLIQKDRTKLAFLAENSLAIFLAGIIGARLVYVVRNYKYFFVNFETTKLVEIFYIWDKNLSLWGGIFAAILALWLLGRKYNENILKWLDIISIAVMGGLVFGNIGTFLDGKNYGIETFLPWGVTIESSRFAVPIHPTQMYAAIYTALITLLLVNLRNSKYNKKEGTIAITAAFSYSVFRFLEEFIRGDESNYFIGIREAQIYALLMIIASAVCGYFYLFYKKKPKKAQPQKPAKPTS